MRFKVSPARIKSCCELMKIMSCKDAIKLSMLSYARDERTEVFLKPWNLSVAIRPATSDLPVLRKIFVDQEYAPPWSIAPTVILDAGAYIGLSTLYYHRMFPNARIIALEPDAETFGLLETNTRSISQVHAVKAALSSSHETKQFIADIDAPWASRVAEGGMDTVSCMTLSDVATMAGGQLDLIKIDIEGGEADAFRAANEMFLQQVEAIVIEFHERFLPGSSAPFYNSIKNLPHEIVIQGENSWFRFT